MLATSAPARRVASARAKARVSAPVHKGVDVRGTQADVNDHACVEPSVIDCEKRRGGKVDGLQPKRKEEAGPLGALRGCGGRRLAQNESALSRVRLELLECRLHLVLPRLRVASCNARQHDVRPLLLRPSAPPLTRAGVEKQHLKGGHAPSLRSLRITPSTDPTFFLPKWTSVVLAGGKKCTRCKKARH